LPAAPVNGDHHVLQVSPRGSLIQKVSVIVPSNLEGGCERGAEEVEKTPAAATPTRRRRRWWRRWRRGLECDGREEKPARLGRNAVHGGWTPRVSGPAPLASLAREKFAYLPPIRTDFAIIPLLKWDSIQYYS
jgi:hypothetical protein